MASEGQCAVDNPSVPNVGGSIKGAALVEFLNWYAASFGNPNLQQKMALLPLHIQQHLDLGSKGVGVINSQWYEAYVIHALLDQIFFGVDEHTREHWIQEGARAVMKATLNGVYKLLFRTMMTPDRYARLAQMLWSRYYDTGVMAKEKISDNVQATIITDWRSHHPIICDLNYEGSRYIYEAMGLKKVAVSRTGCITHGQTDCRFSISWED